MKVCVFKSFIVLCASLHFLLFPLPYFSFRNVFLCVEALQIKPKSVQETKISFALENTTFSLNKIILMVI